MPAASAQASQMYTNPPLPVEGKPFHIVYATDAAAAGQTVAFRVVGADGVVVKQARPTLAANGAQATAAVELTVPHNGMLRATVQAGGDVRELDVPVITSKREIHIIYFGFGNEYLTEGLVRYITLCTSTPANALPAMNARGIKCLAWNYGSNALEGPEKEMAGEGKAFTPEMAFEVGYNKYLGNAADLVKRGYAGDGLDEFGAYAATPRWREMKAYLRGMIAARKKLPKGFIIAAWHGGHFDNEMIGLYKQAVDFLLPEAYVMQITPHDLGTELQDRDLQDRLFDARANDMFTGPYGSKCRVIPCIDVTDKVPVDEYEMFFRMYRREFPEVRGIGFFNTLSKRNWGNYRAIDRLCFDYFVRPVVTFEPDSLGIDRFGKGGVIAYLSNIGGMDSGYVVVRLLVDGKEVGKARVASVPAGFSRADDRAPVRFNWKPPSRGTYRLRVEITDCPDATVLDPAEEEALYLQP